MTTRAKLSKPHDGRNADVIARSSCWRCPCGARLNDSYEIQKHYDLIPEQPKEGSIMLNHVTNDMKFLHTDPHARAPLCWGIVAGDPAKLYFECAYHGAEEP